MIKEEMKVRNRRLQFNWILFFLAFIVLIVVSCNNLNPIEQKEGLLKQKDRLHQTILWNYVQYTNEDGGFVNPHNPFVESSQDYKRKVIFPYYYKEFDRFLEAEFKIRRTGGISSEAYARIVLYEYDKEPGNGIGQILAESEVAHDSYDFLFTSLEIELNSLLLVDSLVYLVAFEMKMGKEETLKPKSLVSLLVISRWEE